MKVIRGMEKIPQRIIRDKHRMVFYSIAEG